MTATSAPGVEELLGAVLSADELRCLADLTGLRGLLGMDGGSGFLAVAADPGRGRRTLEQRGWVGAAADGAGPEEQVREPLRSLLAVLFAGPARLSLTVTSGARRSCVLVSRQEDRLVALLPAPHPEPVACRVAVLAPQDTGELLARLTALDPAAPGRPLGDAHLPPAAFAGLGPRLALEPDSADRVREDLRAWGLTDVGADALLDLLREGGTSVTVQAVVRDGTLTRVEEAVVLGRDGDWWILEDTADDGTLLTGTTVDGALDVVAAVAALVTEP